ncbi:50S ribosomal protein L35 [bacterium]|jgi:ribosomal protein L35|nr:50S ribosomal protein L35 [bacterium]
MKLKTNKALKKRVKITGKKKVLIRTGGQDHFNSRESGKVKRNKRSNKQLSKSNAKHVKKLLPYL